MNISDIAKKIREAVMNRAENDGRVFHADAIEDEVTKILRAEYPPTNVWGYGTNLVHQDPPDTNVAGLDIKRLREAARQIAANSPDDIGTYRIPIRDAARQIDKDGTTMPVFVIDTSRDYTSWAHDADAGSMVGYLPAFPATCTVNGRTVTGPEAEQIIREKTRGEPTEWR